MQTFFTWLWSIGGIGSAITLGAGAAAVIFPVYRRLAIEVAVIAAVAAGVYTKGFDDGDRNRERQCQAAEQQMRDKVDSARRNADRDVDRGVPDRFDRDDN